MTDLQPGEAEPEIVRFNLHAFVMHEWPYLTVLTAVILGVAYTNFAQTPIMPYWVLLAPCHRGDVCHQALERNGDARG